MRSLRFLAASAACSLLGLAGLHDDARAIGLCPPQPAGKGLAARAATSEGPDGYCLRAIAREAREVFAQASPVGVEAGLKAGCKVHTALGSEVGDVRFTVQALDANGVATPILSQLLEAGPAWRDVVVELERDAAGGLILDVDAERRESSAWARPLIRCPSDPVREARNVLLISLDTLRADRLGVYGNDRGLTPNLDAFARRGTTFSRAYSSYGNTLGSHASLFTGLAPSRFESLQGTRLWGRETLARDFAKAGYTTTAFTENGFVGSGFGFSTGFQRYSDGPEVKGGGYLSQPRKTFGQGRDWLAARPKGPFFLFLHTYAVHSPYDPAPDIVSRLSLQFNPKYRGPRTFQKLFRRLNLVHATDLNPQSRGLRQLELLYDAKTVELDRAFGELIATLDRDGHLENSLVVVTADHGEAFGEHGVWGHGETLYSEVHHVPLIFVAKGLVPAGRVVDRPTSLVDIRPTLTELVGLEASPAAIDARSFADAVTGRATVEATPVFSESFATFLACDPPLNRWSLCPYQGVSVRDGDYTFIHSDVSGERFLYDLRDDPQEQRDVSREQPKVAAKFSALVEQYRLAFRTAKPTSGGVTPIDDATLEKLRALGYLE